jgi:hypothetical protein
LPISLVIIGLLAVVATSYRQTIPAYPNGGGLSIVAKENLGTVADSWRQQGYSLTTCSMSRSVLPLEY